MSRQPGRLNSAPRGTRGGESLTERELQVLALVAAGEPTHAISRRLRIAENTIKAHLTSVYKKTGSRNRVQAARYYLDHHSRDAGRPTASQMTAHHPSKGADGSRLIPRQIEEIEARLEELAAEAERLRHALGSLRAIEAQ